MKLYMLKASGLFDRKTAEKCQHMLYNTFGVIAEIEEYETEKGIIDHEEEYI